MEGDSAPASILIVVVLFFDHVGHVLDRVRVLFKASLVVAKLVVLGAADLLEPEALI